MLQSVVPLLTGLYSPSGTGLSGPVRDIGQNRSIAAVTIPVSPDLHNGLRRAGRQPPTDYLLYGFDAVEKGNFAAYDISSVGFDRSALVAGILSFLSISSLSFKPMDSTASANSWSTSSFSFSIISFKPRSEG